MAYREITVGGETYEYVIGRSFTKVKGHAVWPNEAIGNPIDNGSERVVVTPSHVAEMIATGKRARTPKICEIHNLVEAYQADPYIAEMDHKAVYGWWCDECYHDRADSI
jgi:hypothetical protein